MADNWTFGNPMMMPPIPWMARRPLPPTVRWCAADEAVEVKWANHPVGDTREE